jgi:hypothetical protein
VPVDLDVAPVDIKTAKIIAKVSNEENIINFFIKPIFPY